MPINIDKNEFSARPNVIRKLLLPLSRNQNDVAARVTSASRGSIVFAAFSGHKPESSNHNEWFFKTHNGLFKCSYFEVWIEKERKYFLEKAYFRLMTIKNSTNQEVLSLHIDPSELNCKYKSGPHIHIKTTLDKLSKAHISLNLNNLNQVISSYQVFNEAYRNALIMINDEILLEI